MQSIIDLVGVPSIREDDIEGALELIGRRGYDVKEIVGKEETFYVLVRYFDYIGDGTEKFRVHGEINTPLLMSSDWHYGSLGFQMDAFNKMVKDSKKYKCKYAMVAGDVIQGRKVFRTEMQELKIPKIQDQVRGVRRLISRFPCEVKLIAGTHEEKVQADAEIGFDPLKQVAELLPNVSYYGHVGMFKLNDRFKYMMMHGSGAVTQSATHMIERIWRELVERPNILHAGHTHQIADVMKGQGQIALISGTLQRTSAWLLSKGYNAKLGWIILKDFDEETIDYVKRTPIVK